MTYWWHNIVSKEEREITKEQFETELMPSWVCPWRTILDCNTSLQSRVVKNFFFFLGGPAHKLQDLKQGGPAQYQQACKLSRNLFLFFSWTWDYIGYNYRWSHLHFTGPKNGKMVITAGRSLVTISPTGVWSYVHRQHNNERKVWK
jgi:hypothetical protein